MKRRRPHIKGIDSPDDLLTPRPKGTRIRGIPGGDDLLGDRTPKTENESDE